MAHIFFHNKDLDGKCSGALIKYYIENYQHKKCTMHPCDYGDSFPYEEIAIGDDVIIADMSFELEDMYQVNKKFNLTIIDHHKSFIEKIQNTDIVNAKGVRKIGDAACELTWTYFYKTQIPLFVYLLGRYDVWYKKNIDEWNQKILPFQFGMRTVSLNPEENDGFKNWTLFINGKYSDSKIDNIIQTGRSIISYQSRIDENFVNLYSFDAPLDGHKALCMNSPMSNSGTFKSKWNNNIYDIMFSFIRKKDSTLVSLYTDKPGLDVSKIAIKYGGGGHMQAAGFECKNFNVKNDKIIIEN